ncbi:MAG: hypothetical protein ACKOXC_03310 [Aquirufa sp.]
MNYEFPTLILIIIQILNPNMMPPLGEIIMDISSVGDLHENNPSMMNLKQEKAQALSLKHINANYLEQAPLVFTNPLDVSPFQLLNVIQTISHVFFIPNCRHFIQNNNRGRIDTLHQISIKSYSTNYFK